MVTPTSAMITAMVLVGIIVCLVYCDSAQRAIFGPPLPLALDRKLACADRLMPRMRPPCSRPPNGLEVHLRGQGPCGYGSAAHGVHACESRVAGRAPP